jgi:hypothetical protein
VDRLKVISIKKKEPKEQQCLHLKDPKGMYLSNNYFPTHNSPSTVFGVAFAAYSQKKSSELILEPLLNVLDSASYFEKCRTK